ncbi:MAG TPA: hypothetical protein VD811_01210 [Desulfuromonadales bacterium]|nr:hypothetical protein [Desulfuromonadales bacterium]
MARLHTSHRGEQLYLDRIRMPADQDLLFSARVRAGVPDPRSPAESQ